jgi:CubicO group peptidase (beta-lactamase class C family)
MRLMRSVTVAAVSWLSITVAWGNPIEDGGQPPSPQLNRLLVDLDADFASIAPTGPGCAVGVDAPGAVPVTRAYGVADLEHAAPLTPESVFETGSLAKQFTAAGMLLLAQDGKLTLDDDIRRYLPEMPNYGTPITIRHLLTHTSGLREQWSLLALAGSGPGSQIHTQSTILDLASRQMELNFSPGAEFLYTNTNYVLAAIIIERVSGTSLERFTEQRLFRPLGMTHSRWREDFRTIVPGRAMAYAPTSDGFIANMPFTNVYGNGGLLTTVGDLLRWNSFLDQPARLPGGDALVAALETPGRLHDGTTLEYALGLEITRAHNLRLVAHSGSTAGYKTWLGRYPAKGVSVAVLCNNGGVDAIKLGERVAEQALYATGYVDSAPPASLVPPVGVPSKPAELTKHVGLFRNLVNGDLVSTKIADGKLTLTQGSTEILSQIDNGRFQSADGRVVQFVTVNGKATSLTSSTGTSSQRFVAVAPAKTGSELHEYVGTYYSPELDKRVRVTQESRGLLMRQAFAVEWRLEPRFSDGFTTRLRGTTTFVFSRTSSGHVDGFAAWANGVRGIRFVRQP